MPSCDFEDAKLLFLPTPRLTNIMHKGFSQCATQVSYAKPRIVLGATFWVHRFWELDEVRKCSLLPCDRNARKLHICFGHLTSTRHQNVVLCKVLLFKVVIALTPLVLYQQGACCKRAFSSDRDSIRQEIDKNLPMRTHISDTIPPEATYNR